MRYSYEFKLKCVEMYREGKRPDAPKGASQKRFRDNIREWVRMEESCGPEALKHPNQQKQWTPEEKLSLVSEVIAGASLSSVAFNSGINTGMLYSWVRKYKELGYNGLINQKKGRKSGDPEMKKKLNYNNPRPLQESELEELIRLRKENEYIKAEIEVIKKEIALREKKAAQLKAKKQRLSGNSGEKDSH